MLLLDRKEGTSVILTTPEGHSIKVTVIANTDFGVKLGFDAPREVKILREEAIRKGNGNGRN